MSYHIFKKETLAKIKAIGEMMEVGQEKKVRHIILALREAGHKFEYPDAVIWDASRHPAETRAKLGFSLERIRKGYYVKREGGQLFESEAGGDIEAIQIPSIVRLAMPPELTVALSEIIELLRSVKFHLKIIAHQEYEAEKPGMDTEAEKSGQPERRV